MDIKKELDIKNEFLESMEEDDQNDHYQDIDQDLTPQKDQVFYYYYYYYYDYYYYYHFSFLEFNISLLYYFGNFVYSVKDSF